MKNESVRKNQRRESAIASRSQHMDTYAQIEILYVYSKSRSVAELPICDLSMFLGIVRELTSLSSVSIRS